MTQYEYDHFRSHIPHCSVTQSMRAQLSGRITIICGILWMGLTRAPEEGGGGGVEPGAYAQPIQSCTPKHQLRFSLIIFVTTNSPPDSRMGGAYMRHVSHAKYMYLCSGLIRLLAKCGRMRV